MVPEGWRHQPLGNFVSLQRGYDLTESQRKSGHIPVMGSSGPNGWHDTANVRGPGVLLGRSGASFGVAHYCSGDFWAHNTALFVTDFHGNDPLFTYYFLATIDFRSYNSGGAQPSLNRNFIYPIPVAVPPVEEQQKIAEILSTWDEAIEKLERLLELKRERKRALMQGLLTGRVRFKEFEGLEWKQVIFEEVLKLEIGGTPARKEQKYWDEKKQSANYWVAIADIQGKYLHDTKERITDLGVQKSNTKLIPVGTVVMSFKLTIGRRAILARPMYTNEAICALLPKDSAQVDTEYLYQSLEVVDFTQGIDQAVKGKTLNKEKIRQLHLLLPTIEEQRTIATVLSAADAELETLEKQLGAYKRQKRGLMQQLLTGKRRVKV